MDGGLDAVREIALKEQRGELKGEALIVRCTAAALALQNGAQVNDVAEAVWHYLSDADIRVKDPEYGAQQLSQVMKVLGVAPR